MIIDKKLYFAGTSKPPDKKSVCEKSSFKREIVGKVKFFINYDPNDASLVQTRNGLLTHFQIELRLEFESNLFFFVWI